MHRLPFAAARQRHEAGIVEPGLQHAASSADPLLPAVGGHGERSQVVLTEPLPLPALAAVVGHQ